MKKLLTTALFVFAGFASTAQKLDNSLLWKISGNGLSKPSYLYGTIHITCDATLDKNVLSALDATGQVYLELDMDDPNMQGDMMGTMQMKDGVTMKSLSTPEDFKIVDEFLKANMGIGADMLNTFKPFMATAMLYPKLLDCPMQSYEMVLVEAAKTQKEEIYGLETVAEQMAVFDAIPYKEQMDELVKTAKNNMVNDKKEMTDMMALYNKKDLNSLLEFMDKSENKMMAAHNDVLLTNRNKNWIPKIEAVAKAKPTFFGVGAAHLAGENGVIKLLRKKGYKVEAVK
jgi:uncharacterized protein YbaP (TraB family)